MTLGFKGLNVILLIACAAPSRSRYQY